MNPVPAGLERFYEINMNILVLPTGHRVRPSGRNAIRSPIGDHIFQVQIPLPPGPAGPR